MISSLFYNESETLMQRQEKLMPYIFVAILGTIFGMAWAYLIAPPIYAGGNPNRLNEASQQQWILNVAVAASINENISYNDTAVIDLVSRVPHPRETIQSMLNNPNTAIPDVDALEHLLFILPPELKGTPAPAIPNTFAQAMQLLIPIVIVVALGLVLGKVLSLFNRQNSS